MPSRAATAAWTGCRPRSWAPSCPHLDGWVDRRNAIARAYLEGLSGVTGITLPTMPGNGRHAFHLFVIRTEQRDELQAFLAQRDIQTGIHYPIALPKLAGLRLSRHGRGGLLRQSD